MKKTALLFLLLTIIFTRLNARSDPGKLTLNASFENGYMMHNSTLYTPGTFAYGGIESEIRATTFLAPAYEVSLSYTHYVTLMLKADYQRSVFNGFGLNFINAAHDSTLNPLEAQLVTRTWGGDLILAPTFFDLMAGFILGFHGTDFSISEMNYTEFREMSVSRFTLGFIFATNPQKRGFKFNTSLLLSMPTRYDVGVLHGKIEMGYAFKNNPIELYGGFNLRHYDESGGTGTPVYGNTWIGYTSVNPFLGIGINLSFL